MSKGSSGHDRAMDRSGSPDKGRDSGKGRDGTGIGPSAKEQAAMDQAAKDQSSKEGRTGTTGSSYG